jgi:hypothetical protein
MAFKVLFDLGYISNNIMKVKSSKLKQVKIKMK